MGDELTLESFLARTETLLVQIKDVLQSHPEIAAYTAQSLPRPDGVDHHTFSLFYHMPDNAELIMTRFAQAGLVPER